MASVLLLNASYEPLAVISMRRAVSLMLRERVDAATDDILTLKGMTDHLTIPKVLRLRRYISVPQRGVGWSRRGVLHRDKHRCIYCGIQAGEHNKKNKGSSSIRKNDFTIDHIRPVSRGGKNTWSNTACSCPACNQRKGSRMPHEAGMPLLWEPKMPRVDYVVATGDIPQSWKFYLEI